jgi:hypothetical protein
MNHASNGGLFMPAEIEKFMCGKSGRSACDSPRRYGESGVWLYLGKTQVNYRGWPDHRIAVKYQPSFQEIGNPGGGNHISCLRQIAKGGRAMSLAQRVSEIPDAYDHSNLSTMQLLAETGYLDRPQALTVSDVKAALEDDPDLAEMWLQRGRDQRLAGGWFIEHVNDQYRIQNYSTGQYLVEWDRLQACAEFIVRYVDFIRETIDERER